MEHPPVALQSARQSQAHPHLEPDIELHQILKRFAGEAAVQGLNLSIRTGEFFSILGPSGCGKTTTLRLIAGFETPTSGTLRIRGQDMAKVPPYRRPVNTVFQSYALFGHLTVWDNVAFGLKLQRLSREVVRSRTATALQQVKMEAFAHRHPAQLSGGQQQRVALARALVNRPAVLLLDEPLAALDLKLRKEMQLELATLHRALGMTFVMVTHDQEEALSLSDRIAVMNQGRIEQIGTPSQIYEEPQTAFVADFIGDTNLLLGKVVQERGAAIKLVTESALTVWVARRAAWPDSVPQQLRVSIRPEKIRIWASDSIATEDNTNPDHCSADDLDNRYSGWLRQVMFLGPNIQCQVELRTGEQLTILQPNRQPLPALDTEVQVAWRVEDGRSLIT